jgi:hypothetical protein
MESWNYEKYTSSHKKQDFSNLNDNDPKILNYLKKNYHQKDLLNTIVNYIVLLLNNTQVTSGGTLKNVINTQWSKLHVQFIVKENYKYAFDIRLELDINQDFTYASIPFVNGAVAEFSVHSNTTSEFYFAHAYDVATPDYDKDVFAGNNLVFTSSSLNNDNFYIQIDVGGSSQAGVEVDFNKKNWSNVPLVGFDDVKFPAASE